MFQRVEDRLDDRPAVVGVIVVASVVGNVQAVKFAMLDHRSDVVLPEFVPEIVPVVTFVGGDRIQILEISRQYLPANLGIVRLLHRAIDIDDGGRLTVHEGGGFDGLEVVIDAIGVVAAGRVAFEAGGVDGLHFAEVVEAGG